MIYTSELRGIGKTYELIRFAEYNNYSVVVFTKELAELLKKKYNYKYIFSQDQLRGIRNKKIVIDEYVEFEKIKKEKYFEIITGFSKVFVNEKIEENKNFNNNIVEFLKREEIFLRDKADKMLFNDDIPMYVKIINGYEKVVELIKKYDWEFKYSEYKKEVTPNTYEKELAIWEQNSDGVIRNYKKWNVEDSCKRDN